MDDLVRRLSQPFYDASGEVSDAPEQAIDAIESLQAQLAEARDDAAFVAAQLQAVLDMSPPPQEGILKKRLHELAARKNALAEARDKALEDAARKADPPQVRTTKGLWVLRREKIAAAIRAMKGERG